MSPAFFFTFLDQSFGLYPPEAVFCEIVCNLMVPYFLRAMFRLFITSFNSSFHHSTLLYFMELLDLGMHLSVALMMCHLKLLTRVLISYSNSLLSPSL